MYYCSKERQRGDWDDHKARCKKTRAMQIDAQEAIPAFRKTSSSNTFSDVSLTPSFSRG